MPAKAAILASPERFVTPAAMDSFPRACWNFNLHGLLGELGALDEQAAVGVASRSSRGRGVQRVAGDVERRKIAELFPAHHAAARRLQGYRGHQLGTLWRQ